MTTNSEDSIPTCDLFTLEMEFSRDSDAAQFIDVPFERTPADSPTFDSDICPMGEDFITSKDSLDVTIIRYENLLALNDWITA